MSRWSRLVDHLLGAAEQPTTEPLENPMPRPAAAPAPAAELRRQLTALDDEAAADPIAAAHDIAEWQSREQQRTTRRLEIAQQLQRTEALGTLADTSEAVTAWQTYMRAVADHRSRLAAVTRERQWPNTGSDSRAVSRLTGWWGALVEMDRALPDHPDADRLIQRETTAWIAARDAVAAAVLQQHNANIPSPELKRAGLPRNLAYGVHRPEQP